jgi:hypothetical protein
MLKMSMPSRKEYLSQIYKRYRFSSWKEKTSILDEFCLNTGYDRKYSTRILNAPLSLAAGKGTGKAEIYTGEHVYYLKKIWDILDCPCGQRLAPMLPEMIKVLARCKELIVPEALAPDLAKMGSSTIDRRLEPFRKNIWRRIHGTTKPGSLLKKQIPIALSRWNERVPGYAELDLVAHCGMSASGDFVSTLNLTDLATGWTESGAVLGKAQARVFEALKTIERRLPFPLLGIDPDNGSEFINWQLFRYCLEKRIQFTRGRPGKKNDNPYIEEKNWTHVRKIVGYDRLDTGDELAVLNSLYEGPLRLYLNFFQPVMKLKRKIRVGGKLRKKYDVPKTPYRRVLETREISKDQKQKLITLYETLNPVKLKSEIERHLKLLSTLKKEQRESKGQPLKVTFPMIDRIPEKLHF